MNYYYNIRDTEGKLIVKVSQSVAVVIFNTIPGVRRPWAGASGGDCYEINGDFKFSPASYLTVFLWKGYTVTKGN